MNITGKRGAASQFLSILSLIISSSTAAFAQQSSIGSPMANAEVDAYVLRHGHVPHQTPSGANSSDPFAVPSVTPPRNINILLEFPFVRRMSDYQSGPNWHYSVADNKLELKYFVSSLIGENPDWEGVQESADLRLAETAVVEVSSTERVSAGGKRQNSYGASVDVVVTKTIARGIMARSASFREKARPISEDYNYRHIAAIPPDAARALVGHLKVQVLALAVQWRPGDFVQCASSYSAPTIRNPREHLGQHCYLSVEIDAIRFVDARDGAVVREWQK